MLIASSVRPAPIRPLIPTTSPLRMLKFTLRQTFIPSKTGWSTHQSFTSKHTSPIFGVLFGNRSERLLPTIPAIIVFSSKESFSLSNDFITPPSRIIVIVSAT